MKFNAELARKLIAAVFEEMPENRQFGPVCADDATPIAFDAIYDAVTDIDANADIHYGISKLVIISPNLGDYVVKIPFNGMYEDSCENECTREGGCSSAYQSYCCCDCPYGEISDDDCWCDYSNADSPTGWNYCDAEWQKYKKLKKNGLNCFVTKTYPFVEINGFKCFIQEKAVAKDDANGNETSRVTLASRQKAESLNSEFHCGLNEDWLGLCIEIFGTKKVRRFMKYAENVDHEILDDMHSGNYGYRPNGTPCILDFASFYN